MSLTHTKIRISLRKTKKKSSIRHVPRHIIHCLQHKPPRKKAMSCLRLPGPPKPLYLPSDHPRNLTRNLMLAWRLVVVSMYYFSDLSLSRERVVVGEVLRRITDDVRRRPKIFQPPKNEWIPTVDDEASPPPSAHIFPVCGLELHNGYLEAKHDHSRSTITGDERPIFPLLYQSVVACCGSVRAERDLEGIFFSAPFLYELTDYALIF